MQEPLNLDKFSDKIPVLNLAGFLEEPYEKPRKNCWWGKIIRVPLWTFIILVMIFTTVFLFPIYWFMHGVLWCIANLIKGIWYLLFGNWD